MRSRVHPHASRHTVACLTSLFTLWFSAQALAQPEAEAGADAEAAEPETKPGPSMEAEGSDPVDSEVAEKDAPFVPRSNEEDEEKGGAKASGDLKLSADHPLRLSGDVVVGFGETPVPGPTNTRAPDATSIGFRAGVQYAMMPELSLGLDLAWTTASFEERAGAIDESANALGNPMLRLEYRLTAGSWLIPLRFGVGIPVAQGEPDPTSSDTPKLAQTQVQYAADSSRGWREGEYYAVGRLPVSVGAGAVSEGDKHRVEVSQTVLMLPKIKGDVATPTALGDGTVKLNSFGLRSVTEVGFAYWVLAELGAGLRGWLAYNVIESVDYDANEDVTEPSALQLAIEPRVLGKLGPATLHLGYILPLGGQLADGGVSGLRIGAEASF